MSKFKLSTTHNIIPNSQQYMLQYKYVTINSDDRDITKFPNSSEFEIELPQDYVNVQTVKLSSYSFPHNFDVFSEFQNNTTFIFTLAPYYTVGTTNILAPSKVFTINIEDGTYEAKQMAQELTNKMNASVNEYIKSEAKTILGPSAIPLDYQDFIVKYHEVNNKLWFGNKNSEFVLNNGSDVYEELLLKSNSSCLRRSSYNQYVYWGLPYYLGFKQLYITSLPITDNDNLFYLKNPKWIEPTIPGASSFIVKSMYKTILKPQSHFYMEIVGMNNIDETMPMTGQTKMTIVNECAKSGSNSTNGIVNACFAKISTSLQPSTDWVTTNTEPYMIYSPPIEKIRRLRLRFRYHNNMPVNFDNCEFSFVLQFGLFMSQNERGYNVYVPESVANFIS
jgi:hypothetical protein